jgi:hypothetical protein
MQNCRQTVEVCFDKALRPSLFLDKQQLQFKIEKLMGGEDIDKIV